MGHLGRRMEVGRVFREVREVHPKHEVLPYHVVPHEVLRVAHLYLHLEHPILLGCLAHDVHDV